MAARPAAGRGAPAPRPATTWTLALITGLPLTAIGAPNVALPSIAADLSAGFEARQWTLASYALLLAALQFASGPIADRLGRRATTLAGLALFATGSLGAALAPTVGVLIGARAVQGAGGALAITGALALMAASTAGSGRLKAVTLRSAVIAGSFAIGPLVGGLLVDGPGWRAIFWVDALVAVPLAAVLLRARAPEPVAVIAATADWLGLAVLTGGLTAGVGALIAGNDAGWTSAPVVALLAVAACAIAFFVARDRRARSPLLPGRLLREPRFQVTTLGLLGLYFALFGGMVHLTQYLLVARGASGTGAGLVLLPFAVASLVSVVGAMRLYGRVDERRMTTVAFALGAAGLWTLRDLTPDTPLPALLPGLVLIGIASGVVNPLATAGHLASFSPRDGGIAAAVNSSSRQLGTALGTAGLGAVVQHATDAGDGLSPAVGDAMLVGAWVLAALALFAAVRLPGARASRSSAAAAPGTAAAP